MFIIYNIFHLFEIIRHLNQFLFWRVKHMIHIPRKSTYRPSSARFGEKYPYRAASGNLPLGPLFQRGPPNALYSKLHMHLQINTISPRTPLC